MKRNLTILFSVLFTLVLLVWIVFHALVSQQIRSEAESRARLAAGQIVDNLGAELSELEHISYLLSDNDDVVRFTKESDTEVYYPLADEISRLIATSRVNHEFIGNIIVYGEQGDFYRFSGSLSNTSCARVRYLAEQSDTPEHLSVTLEYRNYIGYINMIYDSAGNRTGTLVMLVEEESVLELIRESALGDSLMVTVAARDEVITGNFTQDDEAAMRHVATRHIGLTPFEITVSVSEMELRSSTYYFSFAAIVTAIFFGLLIIVFVRQMNRRFISPMVQIMGNAEKLDWSEGGSYLPGVQNEEFDTLIDKINEMLLRLERQRGEIQTAELRATNAELQKQKAIIFSLKKQINAHFVINTLSTIRVLVEQGDVSRAGMITRDLSALVRYAYEKDDMIGLWGELQMLENYIAIMNVRFANKIELSFDVDDRLMDLMLPRMLLQPIVENAIVHGFKSRREGCEIKICAAQEHGRIVISISDNGAGINAERLAALRDALSTLEELPEGIDHVALINIKLRLYAQYGMGASLAIYSEVSRGTDVLLSIPMHPFGSIKGKDEGAHIFRRI